MVGRNFRYSFDGNELYVLKSVSTQTVPSLILKYQRNELHYKHSYSIIPGQIRVKKKIKIQTLNLKKCTEITENHLS